MADEMELPRENPIYTESQLREMLQSEGDRRVSMAMRKAERELNLKLEEAKTEAVREAQEKFAAESGTLREEAQTLRESLREAQEENSLRQNTLDAIKALERLNVPANLSAFIVSGDRAETLARAEALAAAFRDAVNLEARSRLNPVRPLPAAKISAAISRESFRKMTLNERQELRQIDPDAYNALVSGV